jgi:hypothetical protein
MNDSEELSGITPKKLPNTKNNLFQSDFKITEEVNEENIQKEFFLEQDDLIVSLDPENNKNNNFPQDGEKNPKIMSDLDFDFLN